MTSRHGSGTRAGLLSLTACCAAYLLFAGTVSLSEVVTGAVLGAISAAAAVLLRRLSGRHFAFSTVHFRVWGRAFARRPGRHSTHWDGTGGIAAPVARLPGPRRHATVPSRPDERTDRARRATVVLATSLAPNTFVLNIPLQRHEGLLHGIDGEAPPTNPKWLT